MWVRRDLEPRDPRQEQNRFAGVRGDVADEYAEGNRQTPASNSRLTGVRKTPSDVSPSAHTPEMRFCHAASGRDDAHMLSVGRSRGSPCAGRRSRPKERRAHKQWLSVECGQSPKPVDHLSPCRLPLVGDLHVLASSVVLRPYCDTEILPQSSTSTLDTHAGWRDHPRWT